MLRGLLKTGTAWALHATKADRILGSANGGNELPLVVGYHRVVSDFPSDPTRTIPAMCISKRMLEKQLDWIGRRYRFVSFEELGARMQWGNRFTEPVAAVTFDDGYADVYENAFPLLKKKGIPAAVFVVTDLVGTTRHQIHDLIYLQLIRAFFKWGSSPVALARFLSTIGIRVSEQDLAKGGGHAHITLEILLNALPQEELVRLIEAFQNEVRVPDDVLEEHRAMSWEAVAEMHRAGFTIGSHTRSHILLPVENAQRVADELTGSKRELESRLGTKVKNFAYPCGQFDAGTIRAVARAGYRYGFTICRHRNPYFPLLSIPRRLLWEKSCMGAFGRFSAAVMSCQVNGSFDRMSPCEMDHEPADQVVRAA